MDGILKDRGMVSFAPVMNEEQIENIRAYVIARAEVGKANDEAIEAQ